jgi:hypothetical protein
MRDALVIILSIHTLSYFILSGVPMSCLSGLCPVPLCSKPISDNLGDVLASVLLYQKGSPPSPCSVNAKAKYLE